MGEFGSENYKNTEEEFQQIPAYIELIKILVEDVGASPTIIKMQGVYNLAMLAKY